MTAGVTSDAGMSEPTATTEAGVQIECLVAANVNLAFYQNAVPIIRDLAIKNGKAEELRDVEAHLASEPPFVSPGVWRIVSVAPKSDHHLRLVDIKLDHGFLAGLTASRRAELKVRVTSEGREVASRNVEINLLPPNHWGGVGSAPELLAAFVRPTDPNVDVILREAADKLAKAGRDAAIDGYKTKKKARAWEIAEAIWAALAAHGIGYALPPKSFERQGQPVRGPGDLLVRRIGTCLDLTLFYASCLEQAGLNPLVVLTSGHAFAGLWLVDEDFTTAVVEDAQAIRKRVDLDEIVLVETTAMTGQNPARFRQAVDLARKHIAEDAEKAFELAVDVKRARTVAVRPLNLDGSSPAAQPQTDSAQAAEIEEPPAFEEDLDHSAPDIERPKDRLEQWKASLLDLSLRNRLLNFKESKATIALECPDAPKLVAGLSGRKGFKIFGRSKILDGSDGRDPELLRLRENADLRRDALLDALGRDELHSVVSDEEIETRLTELYRASRLAFEEGGANILYLCLGFLNWTQVTGGSPCLAPLMMLPVRLERKSVRSGFKLHLHEDDARFNPTLLQMLKRDFALDMPDVERDFASSLDVSAAWRAVRQHIRHVQGFEVSERIVLSTLSFTKYLMWKDLVDRTEDLKRNPVVRHLIDTPTHAYRGGGGDFIDPRDIDSEVDPGELFAPLSADSSQLAAVVAAQRGKDFVLFGPPGTGKSQTITNMIVNCLAHGKTVLFVSQKTAALEVVQRRLKEIDLDFYCLACHSTKAQKTEVIEQLAQSWRRRAAATEDDWTAATTDLRAKRDELNSLVSALHRRRENGLSAYEAFGRVIADRDFLPNVELTWEGGLSHPPEVLSQMRATCGDLRTALLAVGDPSIHRLRGIEQTRWTPQWSHDFTRLAAKMKGDLAALQRSAAAFEAAIGFTEEIAGAAELDLLLAYGERLLQPEAFDGAALVSDDADRRIRALRAAAATLREIEVKTRELSAGYDLAVVRLDLADLQRKWANAVASKILFRGGAKNKVRQVLAPYCPSGVPADIGRDIVVLQALGPLLSTLERMEPAFAGMEGLWMGQRTDPARFEPLIAWAGRMGEALQALGARNGNADDLRQHCMGLLTTYAHLFAAGGAARVAYEAFASAWTAVQATGSELGRCLALSEPEKLLELRVGWIEALAEDLSRWTANLNRAQPWTRWRAAASTAREQGLGSLVDAIEAGVVSADRISPVFEYAYAKWCAEEIVNGDPILSGFLAEQHDALIEAFKTADERVGRLSQQILRARIGGQLPSMTNFGADPEWGALAHEAHKKARHLPLRQLFGKIPNVLTRLAPCVMMSPLSIAQYLPPDAKPFDVVVFDEASQVPVWDAIGAIARGSQVVVVGDPEQLPPTSIGQRNADGVDDDPENIQTQQSILDECLSSNLPALRLTWHYRSRHESLIAFSNAKYYGGELVTFPSPFTRDAAVRFVEVAGGVYERGKAKVNRKEADAVVEDVVRRLRTSSQSVGVVTFNAEQQKLIENKLDAARRSDPALDVHFDREKTREPVLVKNIENVQGDERDVIVFSVAVGPDETGRVTAQISSLNGEGGHRRLNVAVTRARRELVVFSTLRPQQIDLGRTGARGVADFKHFLEFAQRGTRAIAEAFAPTGGGTESPFEDAVRHALEAKGWEVHPQIGVSYFRVDLGVVHPREPGRYLAGVECDGATYHRSATARDRDRLREMHLTSLGWRIRRIWSTEWWIDAAAALEKIHQKLLEDLADDEAKQAQARMAEPAHEAEETELIEAPKYLAQEREPEPVSEEPAAETLGGTAQPTEDAPQLAYADRIGAAHDFGEPASGLTGAVTEAYEVAEFGAITTADRNRFYDPEYIEILKQMVDRVVLSEAPIFFDVLVDRIADAHGFQRTRSGIRARVREAVGRRFKTTREEDREIIWLRDAGPDGGPAWRGAGRRDPKDIPLVELASLASELRTTILDEEEVVRAMQDRLGVRRLSATTRERLEAAVRLS